ncbi:MAG: hypothetical protein D6701_06175, partial [Gemmatimonadetes bacterium]
MSPGAVLRRGGWLAGVALTGCLYLNTVYNARRLYEDADAALWAGRDTAVLGMYQGVIERAREAYAEDPDGPWADDALLLEGRAHLRRREWPEAERALRRAFETTPDPEVRAEARLYLGALAVARGQAARGLPMLDEALRGPLTPEVRGEGHLWRARALLATGQIGQAWWDLDRATAVDGRYRVPADLERLAWSVAIDDTARARDAARGLFENAGARTRGDSVRALLAAAVERWGPARALAVLDRAEHARWSRVQRDALLLFRGQVARRAGDTVRAVADLERVAGGAGAIAR